MNTESDAKEQKISIISVIFSQNYLQWY